MIWEVKDLLTGEVSFYPELLPEHVSGTVVATSTDGQQLWVKNGLAHRLDGPAVTWGSPSYESYHIEGVTYPESKFEEMVKTL